MRTGGDETRKKILAEAERLFAEKGFDGTSVGMIADAVGINKGLIYYHFKNKDDIIASLFLSVIDELLEHLAREDAASGTAGSDIDIKTKMRQEITFLEPRKRILSVMLMEAFKNDDRENFLLKCADIYLKHEGEYLRNIAAQKVSMSADEEAYRVFEFFTGFIPVITFVAMRDTWCRHYSCDGDRLLDLFLDSFTRTHLAAHEREAGD
jgi:AcrR family transcriptional regulator